jgi:alpha-aminoadipate carrier protein LysW
MTMTAACPECDAPVGIADDTEAGEIVACGDCGVDLEVVGLAPPRLDVAPPEEEDWGE